MYSFHSGGVNVCFADGHVSFFSTSTGIGLIAAMVTKGGGEIVQPP
jgi:prepilin-type processing-associated H-X9-DG protein